MLPGDASNISGPSQKELSNTQVLWGTNINTNDLQNGLKDFLLTYTNTDDLNGQGDDAFMTEPLYISKLKNMAETEDYTLEVDCNHLYEYKRTLYKQLEDYPADVIPIFDLVALQVFKEQMQMGAIDSGSNIEGAEQNEQIIQVRPFNLRNNY